MKARILALGASALALASSAVSSTFAFTTTGSGFPVVESADTTTMLNGVGSAGTGLLNFIISQWTVIIAIIVVGAIVGFVKSLRGSAKWAVHGR